MVTLKKQIVAGEYIGKKVAVFSKDDHEQSAQCIVAQGIIVDETKNTFVVQQEDGNKKKVIKKDVMIVADFCSKKIKVDGLLLAKRSEDRIKTKI